MNYDETGKLRTMFVWAIGFTIAIGVIAGIYIGDAFAYIELDEYGNTKEIWGSESAVAMGITLVLTYIVAVQLYAKKCTAELLDDIGGRLFRIEEQTRKIK